MKLSKFGIPKPNTVRQIVVFLLGFLCINPLHSQDEKIYPFAHYNLNNGLAAYNANSVIQDRQGFIWIGTINGLQRFDGHRFLTFRRIPGDKNSISDNYIDHLFYDSRGNLWLVLGNGQLGIFDTRRFIFKPVALKVRDERTLRLPRKLMEDSDGNLFYIIYGHEITMYNSRTAEFCASPNNIRLPQNWKPLSLVEYPHKKQYWIATDSGLCVYNKRTHLLSYLGHNSEKIKFIEQYGNTAKFKNLLIDSLSRFWYVTPPDTGTSDAMNCYDLKNEKMVLDKQVLFPGVRKVFQVNRMLHQDNGKIWIGGINVFMRYNESRNQFEPASDSTSERVVNFQEVNTLFEDRENNIWLSTNNNGVYILKPSSPLFISVKHVNRVIGKPNEGGVISLSYDDENHIIAGIWGDGIHIYDSVLRTFSHKRYTVEELKPYTIWSICKLRNDYYWLGLQSGILIYDVVYGKTKYYNPSLFKDKLVRTVAEDKLGNIWLGLPDAGVFKWNPQKGKDNFEQGFKKLTNTPSAFIEKITVDSKGYVWVCTLMDGVYKINPVNDSIVEHLTTKGPARKRLLANAATDAFEFNDSIMVIPTGALNIYNTRSDSVIQISSADGLPSDIVRSVQKDSHNNLWLGLFNGLCRMNLFKKTFTYYDRNDGMANDNFNYSSSCQLPNGRLVFGTTTDFLVFDPNDLNSPQQPPNVTITEFRIMNRPLSVDSLQKVPKIQLSADQNFLTIGFSGLSFYNNKWTYYYMLEGLDKEWKTTGDLNQVNYNFIPAGKYTFKVKTENAEGLSSGAVTEMIFEVEPPLFKTWWFYSLVILFIAFILYLIDRERMRKKAAMQKMRADIADNLHAEVNTALNRINILSEMARIKAEKDPVKSSEYFDQIHKKSHEMIIAMDDMLWSIDPGNDSMPKMVERLKEYIDALKNRHATNIDLLVDKRVEHLMLNMRLRHDVFVLMKEGIRSVVQAGTKNCKVHIGLQKECLIYTMEIENRHCDLQQLNNLVQQIELEKRLAAIDAKLTTDMHKFTSRFELQVPV